MAADPKGFPDGGPSARDFNKELLCGEAGALLVANGAALGAAHFTRSAALISSCAVVGTLAGGSLFWLAARLYDRTRAGRFATKELAIDLSYFTPAAMGLGFAVYEPSLYAASHYLLLQGAPVGWAVTAGQAVAFALYLLGMNACRLSLLKLNRRRL